MRGRPEGALHFTKKRLLWDLCSIEGAMHFDKCIPWTPSLTQMQINLCDAFEWMRGPPEGALHFTQKRLLWDLCSIEGAMHRIDARCSENEIE